VPPKLVLAVIDGLHPAALRAALADGTAPALAAIAERATVDTVAAAAFPSVTPVCAATIATGRRQEAHHIPSMNWFHREEDRYVEYGSSFSAARAFGIRQQLEDTVYALNATHLAADVPTVFETLDDAGVRTAGTTYLVYRGRHPHEMAREFPMSSMVARRLFGDRPVMGPRELFYADLFASRETGCRSLFANPGQRDRHTGCVGAYLVEHDLFDFMLFSLPDNDTHSHRAGVRAQLESVAVADRELMRLMEAGGGPGEFLDEHAVIVAADHAHADVYLPVRLFEAFATHGILGAKERSGGAETQIAVCPAQRAAMIYVLDPARRARLLPRLAATARTLNGVDLAAWRASDGSGAVASVRGELRFAPGGDVIDLRGESWSVDGDLGVLEATAADGRLLTPVYPDALGRLWSALTCPTAGDLLLSAAPGFEFPDWGGKHHTGGGSHGSLHHEDSLGALLACGVTPPPERAGGAWSIADLYGMSVGHFGIA
jgi:Type I phosphodiesterase / nucleotide pyrophosphatase